MAKNAWKAAAGGAVRGAAGGGGGNPNRGVRGGGPQPKWASPGNSPIMATSSSRIQDMRSVTGPGSRVPGARPKVYERPAWSGTPAPSTPKNLPKGIGPSDKLMATVDPSIKPTWYTGTPNSPYSPMPKPAPGSLSDRGLGNEYGTGPGGARPSMDNWMSSTGLGKSYGNNTANHPRRQVGRSGSW